METGALGVRLGPSPHAWGARVRLTIRMRAFRTIPTCIAVIFPRLTAC